MKRARLAAAVASGVAAGAGASCSLLLPFNEVQCATTGDCVARGAAFAGAACVDSVCVMAAAADGEAGGGTDGGVNEADAGPAYPGAWACLGSPPLPSADPNALVDVEFVAFDVFQPWTLGGSVDGGNDLMLIQGTPEVGVAVQACDSLDPLCTRPVADAAPTDDAGTTHLSILGGFSGFYEMTRSDSFPTLFYPGRLVAGEPRVSYPTGTLVNQAAAGIGGIVGITVTSDPEAGVGHLFYAAFDCTEHHASGVSFALVSVDAGTQFYLQNRFPNAKATQTDPSGIGGWLNLPAGNVEISLALADGGLPLGTRNVLVRPAAATLVFARPRVR